MDTRYARLVAYQGVRAYGNGRSEVTGVCNFFFHVFFWLGIWTTLIGLRGTANPVWLSLSDPVPNAVPKVFGEQAVY